MWGGGGGCIYLDRFPNQSYWAHTRDFLLENMAHKKWIPKIYILIRWLSPSILTPIKQLEAKLGLGIAKLNRSQRNKINIMQYSEKGCEDKRAETRWLNSMGPSWTRSSVCLILLERSRTMIFNPAHVVLVFNWQEIPLSTSRCLVRLGLFRKGVWR